jgi:hypothetical protein
LNPVEDFCETPRSGDFQIAEPLQEQNGASVGKPLRPKQSGDMNVAALWAMTFTEVAVGVQAIALDRR